MPKLLADQPALYYAPGADAGWDGRIMGWLNQVRAQARAGVTAPAEIRDVRTALDDMRLIKDEGELAVMRRAAAISVAAHDRAMRGDREGKAGQPLGRSARCRGEDARSRIAGFGAVLRDARKSDRDRGLQALRHAPHRTLARPGRPRRRRIQIGRGMAPPRAGHDLDRRTGLLHPACRRRTSAILEHGRAHRGRRCRDALGVRSIDCSRTEIGPGYGGLGWSWLSCRRRSMSPLPAADRSDVHWRLLCPGARSRSLGSPAKSISRRGPSPSPTAAA